MRAFLKTCAAAAALAGLTLVACTEAPVQQTPPGAAPQNNATSWGETGSTATVKTDAAITTTLVDLLDHKDKEKIDLSQSAGTPVGDILQVGSPIGYALRNRYLNIGIPISEALSRDPDPDLRAKLITLARWDSDPETRSAALITVAQAHDPKDLQIFNEALVFLDPAVRFGALEALQVWGHVQQSAPLLAAASEKDAEPILRVYAAQGLARLGDPNGLQKLRQFLDDPSWIVRAMAGRYIGDFGTAEDYDIIVGRIGRETGNDFVVAEYCIAGLKLYPKKKAAEEASQKIAELVGKPPKPAPRGAIPDPMETAFQLEPLVITAPRAQLGTTPIDPQINGNLVRLLQQRMDARPTPQDTLDASIGNLNKLTTLTGYNLKVRYTELGFLLTEGLAGTTDYQLASELEKAVRLGTNPQTRAAALVALAYTHDAQYIPLMQSAIQDPNVTVRFGALEALLINGDPSVQLMVGNMARTDQSLPIQIYAAAGMWRMGDIFGREILERLYQNPDWFVRAMSTHYLGELGKGDEYRRLMLQLPGETEPAVKAELADALLRLQHFQEE